MASRLSCLHSSKETIITRRTRRERTCFCALSAPTTANFGASARGEIPNASEYSTYHKIDSSVVFRYECSALYAPLENIETLAHAPYPTDTLQYHEWARSLPKPFTYLASVTSRSVLACPVLDEIYGEPYFAVVKGEGTVTFKNLEGSSAASLICRPLAAAAGRVSFFIHYPSVSLTLSHSGR